MPKIISECQQAKN